MSVFGGNISADSSSAAAPPSQNLTFNVTTAFNLTGPGAGGDDDTKDDTKVNIPSHLSVYVADWINTGITTDYRDGRLYEVMESLNSSSCPTPKAKVGRVIQSLYPICVSNDSDAPNISYRNATRRRRIDDRSISRCAKAGSVEEYVRSRLALKKGHKKNFSDAHNLARAFQYANTYMYYMRYHDFSRYIIEHGMYASSTG
jgi:hypothetical protein